MYLDRFWPYLGERMVVSGFRSMAIAKLDALRAMTDAHLGTA